MNDLRTEVEKQIHESIITAICYFTQGQMSPKRFMEIMGMLRDAATTLEKKRLGCILGKHESQCLCHVGVAKTIYAIKHRNGRKYSDAEK